VGRREGVEESHRAPGSPIRSPPKGPGWAPRP
jgi:hypothetical protein